MLVPGRPGPKRVTQERERGVLMPPRRLSSLQYTILVLSGCSSSPTSTIRAAIAERSRSAWPCVAACTTKRVAGGNLTPRRSQNRA